MKNISQTKLYIIAAFTIIAVLGSCSNNGIKTPQEIITTKDTIANVPTASLKQVDPYSTPAIGNLYLGVSLSEFEKQKRIFLTNTPQLAGLKIIEIIPLLYNDKVERIVIISEKHLYYETFQDRISTTSYWKNLYDEKYGKGNWNEMNGKIYSVSDDVVKPLPYREFLFERTEEFEKAALQNVFIRDEQRVLIQHLNCYRFDAHSIITITNKPLYDSVSIARDRQDREEREKKHLNDLNVI